MQTLTHGSSPSLLGKLASRRLPQARRSLANSPKNRFGPYQFDPAGYIRKFLGWEPWSGTAEHPGQQQVIDAYVLALQQQFERYAFQRGDVQQAELRYW